MKKTVIAFMLAGLLVLSATSYAQFRKIPAEVTEAFKQKFPNANAVEWKDKLRVFQASFEMKDEDYHAKFNSKGEWQETEKIIEHKDLPEAINDGYNKSKYSDWEIKERSFIEKKDGTEEYRMLVKKSDLEKKYLYFDPSGKLKKDAITL